LPPVDAASDLERSILRQQLEREFNTIPTSSVGRLFDAVSALAGVRQRVNYEAQAAIELEMRVDPDIETAYAFNLGDDGVIDPAPLIRAVVDDVRAGVSASTIAARFHNGLAEVVVDVCRWQREETGIDAVALSGGVFQNVTLLGLVVPRLRDAGFTVYTHRQVPPNDGGIALGQAVVAAARSGKQDEG
jgi:hydrogenase maturation protein HypF